MLLRLEHVRLSAAWSSSAWSAQASPVEPRRSSCRRLRPSPHDGPGRHPARAPKPRSGGAPFATGCHRPGPEGPAGSADPASPAGSGAAEGAERRDQPRADHARSDDGRSRSATDSEHGPPTPGAASEHTAGCAGSVRWSACPAIWTGRTPAARSPQTRQAGRNSRRVARAGPRRPRPSCLAPDLASRSSSGSTSRPAPGSSSRSINSPRRADRSPYLAEPGIKARTRCGFGSESAGERSVRDLQADGPERDPPSPRAPLRRGRLRSADAQSVACSQQEERLPSLHAADRGERRCRPSGSERRGSTEHVPSAAERCGNPGLGGGRRCSSHRAWDLTVPPAPSRFLPGPLARQIDQSPAWLRPIWVALLVADILLLGAAAIPQRLIVGGRALSVIERRRLALAMAGIAIVVAVAIGLILS